MQTDPKAFAALSIDQITALPRERLIILWRRHHKCSPPKGIRRGLLERSAAWHLQARRHGQSMKTIQAIVRQLRTPDGKTNQTLSPGARLIREWQGRTYIVDVTNAGFELDGEIYGSLTAVARKITGRHRSGPKFFGL